MKTDSRIVTSHPKALSWWTADGETEMVQCPSCGHVDDLDGFDVLFADYGCVFCTQCHEEIDLT